MTSLNELTFQMLCVVLGLKYQLVASSMTQYVKGHLDSKRHANLIRVFFGLMMACTFISFVVYVVKCFSTSLNSQLLGLETSFSICGLLFQLTLFGCYLKSMIELNRAIKKTSDAGESNCKMQFVNLTFYTMLCIVQLFCVLAWQKYGVSVITIMSVRTIVELMEKVTIIFLVNQFGQKLTVKTMINAAGELTILGIEDNKNIFQFTVKP